MKKFLFLAMLGLTLFSSCEQTDDDPIVNNSFSRGGETLSDTITVTLTSSTGVTTTDNLILTRCPDENRGHPGADGDTWETGHTGRDNKGNYYSYTQVEQLWPGGRTYFCCPRLTSLKDCP